MAETRVTGHPLPGRRAVRDAFEDAASTAPKVVWALGSGLYLRSACSTGCRASSRRTQIFLMGLRHYATGAWPYFGPDVVDEDDPGRALALLVSAAPRRPA
jgi:hypothetical protein